MDTRQCPQCGEEIRAEAIRCRFCRSWLTHLDPERWHRDHPERRLAGVAAAIAHAFAVPVGAVRLGFVILSFVHLLGLLLYVALWLTIPFASGGGAVFEDLAGRHDRPARRPPPPTAPPPANGHAIVPEGPRPW
jgi:phage shock protein PspC (stress-responsive transcriptional regulator)